MIDHFPVYMWAGPGTVRMNTIKFPGSKVNERVHILGGLSDGARKLADMGYNWAYCTYNWGFPPEIEREDHEFFERTVREYHDSGLRVFGYVQFSNVVFMGSYVKKRWYAIDPLGNKIHYHTDRYLVCPTDPGWKEHLKEIVKGIVDSGADGVFFDNVFGSWYGHRPCFCERCQREFKKFAHSMGYDVSGIPEYLSENLDSKLYLLWRREHLWRTISELAEYARNLKHDIWISSNSFEACSSKLAVIAGVDLRKAVEVQDVLMIENHLIPRKFSGIQVFNTMTYRTAKAVADKKGIPVSSIPYALGIGADDVYPIRTYLTAMSEAYSNDSILVLKGTEYVHDGEWTLITDDRFADVRNEIKNYNSWFKRVMKDSFGKRATRIGVFLPYDSLFLHWDKVATTFFAAQHILIAAGIDYRVVLDEFDGIEVLIVPPIVEESDLELVEKFDGHVVSIGRPFKGDVIWKNEYERYVLSSMKPDFVSSTESTIDLLVFREYFSNPVWRRKLDSSHFLMTNFLRYSYPFVHHFDSRELVSRVMRFQGWKLKADGFAVLTSYRDGDHIKIHVVNLEDKDLNFEFTTPPSWKLENVEEYRFNDDLIHGIYTFFTG